MGDLADDARAGEERAAEAEAEVQQGDGESYSQWEFVDRIPTVQDVRDLLATLPDVYGVRYVDYLDYVQGLPAQKKVKRRVATPSGASRVEEEKHEIVTLYMSVAGRVKMLNDAAEKNGWRVEFEPEPVTPTGAPGFISLEQRIVYREYVRIYAPVGMPRIVGPETKDGTLEVREWQPIGSRSGQAWVPFSGGSQAAGSNPYEKVETSARGRAIAAWGIGVLPGSGIASLDEMLGVESNRRAMQEPAGGITERMPREQILENVLTRAEEVRQARRIPEEDMREKMAEFLKGLGIKSVWDDEDKTIDWAKVKDGQLVLMLNSLTDTLRNLRAQEAPL